MTVSSGGKVSKAEEASRYIPAERSRKKGPKKEIITSQSVGQVQRQESQNPAYELSCRPKSPNQSQKNSDSLARVRVYPEFYFICLLLDRDGLWGV